MTRAAWHWYRAWFTMRAWVRWMTVALLAWAAVRALTTTARMVTR